VETVACQEIIRRRGYLQDETLLNEAYENSQILIRKLQSFRKSISAYQVKEESPFYGDEDPQ
jgi:hypothetical protein